MTLSRGRALEGPPASGTNTGVLPRAVAILEAVHRGARTYTDVVRATNLPRSTAHRLIRALQDQELLAFRGESGFEPGPRLLRLGVPASQGLPLRELARPALERLAAVTGESSQLYVMSGGERLCIDSVESDDELRTIVPVGSALPLTAGSAGKVFMAWMSDSGRLATVGRARKLTDDTPVAKALERELESTRRRGWASSAGERKPGVGSVSAPVLGSDELMAVVSISGPTNRVGQVSAKRYVPAVVSAAHEIEQALGVDES